MTGESIEPGQSDPTTISAQAPGGTQAQSIAPVESATERAARARRVQEEERNRILAAEYMARRQEVLAKLGPPPQRPDVSGLSDTEAEAQIWAFRGAMESYQIAQQNLGLGYAGFGGGGQTKEDWDKAYQQEEAARRAAAANEFGVSIEEVGKAYMGDWEGGPSTGSTWGGYTEKAPSSYNPETYRPEAFSIGGQTPEEAQAIEERWQPIQASVQAGILGVSEYLEGITPTSKKTAAGWDLRREAMERGTLAQRKKYIEEGLATAYFPPEYRENVEEYLGAAESYEGELFQWAAIPEKRNYWTGRLQEPGLDLPPFLAGAIAGAEFGMGEPSPAASDMFAWAKGGGMREDLLPATFPEFTHEVQGEKPGQTPIGTLGTWGIEFTNKAVTGKEAAAGGMQLSFIGPAFKPQPGPALEMEAPLRYPEEKPFTGALAEWSLGVSETIERGAGKMGEYGPAGIFAGWLAKGGSWPVTVPAAVTGAELMIRNPTKGASIFGVTAVATGIGTIEAFKERPLESSVELGAGILVGYGISKGVGLGYEHVQPRFAELKIMLKTSAAEWKPTNAAINIFQRVKGLDVPGASTPDLSLVESIGPENAPAVTGALVEEPHAIFGRTTEIGQMGPEWIEPRGYTYDVDVFMTKASEKTFTGKVGGKGAFDIHAFPEKYPLGTAEPIEGYAAEPPINPLPKTKADLLFTETDPFAQVEIELRGKTGLFSRESAVLQRPSGEIVPTKTIRRFGSVKVEQLKPGTGLIDWHTHPADITARLDAFLPPGEPVPVEDILRNPSMGDIQAYIATNVKEGRIVTPKETVIIKPGKEGWMPGGRGTIEYLEPTLTAETKTGLVSEKLRIQTGRKVASILGEPTEEGGWQIGPPIHRLKDVYDTMRYGSFFAEQEKAGGGLLGPMRARGFEADVLSLQDYYGNPANLEGRYLPQDVAIYGKAIREFKLGEPQGGLSGETISLMRARPEIGEPAFAPPPGYQYPTEGYPEFGESPLFVPSPSPSTRIRASETIPSPSPSFTPSSGSPFISLPGSRSPGVSKIPSPSLEISLPKSPSIFEPSAPTSPPVSRSPFYQPPSYPTYSPPPSMPPYSPPSRSPPYSPPSISPPYSPPSSPPTRTPPNRPPGTFIDLFHEERRGNRPAKESYVSWKVNVAPMATFEEAFTTFKPPPIKPLPHIEKRWNIRMGKIELLPPVKAPRYMGSRHTAIIERPTDLFWAGTGKPVKRRKHRSFGEGLL